MGQIATYGSQATSSAPVIMSQIPMRLAGFFLLVTGWLIVLTAIVMLRLAAQSAFVWAGFLVQVFGLIQVFRSHAADRDEND